MSEKIFYQGLILLPFMLIIAFFTWWLINNKKKRIALELEDAEFPVPETPEAFDALIDERDRQYLNEIIIVEWTDEAKGTRHKVSMKRWEEEKVWNKMSLAAKRKQVIPVADKDRTKIEIDGQVYSTNIQGKSQAAKQNGKRLKQIDNIAGAKYNLFKKSVGKEDTPGEGEELPAATPDILIIKRNSKLRD